VKCLSPGGAFYVFPNVTAAVKKLGLKDSEDLRKLLLKHGVAVLSDIHFGPPNPGDDEQHIRLSYVASKQNITDGLAIIKDVIEGRRK